MLNVRRGAAYKYLIQQFRDTDDQSHDYHQIASAARLGQEIHPLLAAVDVLVV